MAVEGRRRVGIVGAGLAGAVTAWLLDDACETVLFEASPRLGGHNHTVTVDVRGVPTPVDLGAQFYGPLLQPVYTRFLTHLGRYAPATPDHGPAITRSMGTTLMATRDAAPLFVSPMFWDRAWPLWAPWNAAGQGAFFALAVHARRFERDGDWSVTLDEWIRAAPLVTAHAREAVLLPWLAALAGCPVADIRTFSARAALAVPGRAIPANYVSPFRWSNARDGLEALVRDLTAGCAHLAVHAGRAVTRLLRGPGGWEIHAEGGPPERVDAVVVACPPHHAGPLLADAPDGPAVAAELGAFRSFRTRMLVHADPAYMHADRRFWSAYNAIAADGWCEGSVWLGAIRDRHPDGGTVDVYKSWATGRRWEPREVLAEAEYRHALLTPDHFAAQARIAARQGRDGLWFAGSWTRDVDLQETALLSALDVVRRMGVRPRWDDGAALAAR